MLGGKQCSAILLSLAALAVCGCGSSQASLTPLRQSQTASFSSSEPSSVAASRPSLALPAAKRPPRDSAFAVYHNPEYGVSFRYPRNYALEEEVEEEGTTFETQRELSAEQPGAVLLATVEIPDDAYPNTTFAGGHLQLAVNPGVTPDVCSSFVVQPDSGWDGITGATTVQGITFYWREQGSTVGGITYDKRDYAGFSNGTCYEFFLMVASNSASDYDAPIAQGSAGKIFRPLEKIVSSLQIRPMQ